MAFTRLSPEAKFVTYGFGQVEPNHLSAQRTGEIYAQLPVAADIDILENGQFVKYDYLNGACNFTGAGEWMLVFNEVKVYRDHETDQDFAMIRRDYNGRVYSPVGVGAQAANMGVGQAFGENGVRINGYNSSEDWDMMKKIQEQVELYPDAHNNAAGKAPDYGRGHYAIGNSYEVERLNVPQMADYARPAAGENDPRLRGLMVPRVFKTHEGDIFTTNTLADEVVTLGATLGPNNHGYLALDGDKTRMEWQIVKIYNLGDMQKAVKVMRIK
jgi:hypothetical protein